MSTDRTETLTTRYGRESDLGRTNLGDVGDIWKDDIRLQAFAACEEANTAIGHALAASGFDVDVARTLTSVQNDLFDLTADLGAPMGQDLDPEPVRIVEDHIAWVDRAWEHYSADLKDVDGFVLPGGTLPASLIYQARVAVRRAERVLVGALKEYSDINPLTAKYLNSASTLLFALARFHNTEHGDMMWRPLASITPPGGEE